jgi:hypothetical protein
MRAVLAIVASVGVLAAGCSSGSERNDHNNAAEATTTRSTLAPSSEPVSEEVVLTDVVYECGPTDAPVVSIRAASTQALSAIAELVVLDQVFGSSGPIDLGSVPQVFTVDLQLTSEAYEFGAGEVRIRPTDSDEGLATSPVVLQLSGGGCG